MDRMSFSDEEMEVIKKIHGHPTITEVSITEGINLSQALKLIWALFSLRMVGMVQTEESKSRTEQASEPAKAVVSAKPQAEPVKPLNAAEVRQEIEKRLEKFEDQNFFEILQVERKDSASKVRKAYLRMAKKFHPDVLSSLGLQDLLERGGSLFAKMTQAHDTLTKDAMRREYEASLDVDPDVVAKVNQIVEAEMEFQKGELLLKNRSYPAAHDKFSRAMELNPDEPEHFVYLAWSGFLKASGDKQRAAKEARDMIQKGLRMRANMDVAYLMLGRIARALKDMDLAQRQFNEALRINPANEEAESELRVMLRRK